jgi:hypothetical protein
MMRVSAWISRVRQRRAVRTTFPMAGGVLDPAADGQRRTPGSATSSAVELFPEDVRVSGVPGGRHVGHDPPERVPVAVDRDDEARFWVADDTDRAVLSSIAAR